MTIKIISVAAATAVAGYNLMTNSPELITSGGNRLIENVALTGSAAAGDTEVSIRIASTEIARIFNTATGFPTQDASKIDLGGALVPAGEPVSAIILDAPATNPINLQIDLTEL